jgi:hypothetical protein
VTESKHETDLLAFEDVRTGAALTQNLNRCLPAPTAAPPNALPPAIAELASRVADIATTRLSVEREARQNGGNDRGKTLRREVERAVTRMTGRYQLRLRLRVAVSCIRGGEECRSEPCH